MIRAATCGRVLLDVSLHKEFPFNVLNPSNLLLPMLAAL